MRRRAYAPSEAAGQGVAVVIMKEEEMGEEGDFILERLTIFGTRRMFVSSALGRPNKLSIFDSNHTLLHPSYVTNGQYDQRKIDSDDARRTCTL